MDLLLVAALVLSNWLHILDSDRPQAEPPRPPRTVTGACRIESLQLEHIEKLERAIVMYLVVAYALPT
jgi:hypothetical protein